jgi:uncharacterized protein (DUF2147 family)
LPGAKRFFGSNAMFDCGLRVLFDCACVAVAGRGQRGPAPSSAPAATTAVAELISDLSAVASSIARPALFGLLLAAATAGAADRAPPAPTGTWTTIDDESQQPRALVEIGEHAGLLTGRIVKLFRDPGEDPDPRCSKCEGARHDQRVIGMTILWNVRRHGDDWDGGEILDPESGSIYRVTLHPADDGKTLEVRGYIGVPLLGRTQVWQRRPAP